MTQEQANAIESYANAKVAMALANQKLQQLFGPLDAPKVPDPTVEVKPNDQDLRTVE